MLCVKCKNVFLVDWWGGGGGRLVYNGGRSRSWRGNQSSGLGCFGVGCRLLSVFVSVYYVFLYDVLDMYAEAHYVLTTTTM